MKAKKLIPLFVLMVLSVVSLSLSGCGLFSVNTSHSGASVSSNKLQSVPLGSSQNYVLTKFGQPTRQTTMNLSNGKEDIWYYCWSRGSGGSFLFGTFNNEGSKTKCATFIFGKDGKLVSRGIGAAGEQTQAPTKVVEHKISVMP